MLISGTCQLSLISAWILKCSFLITFPPEQIISLSTFRKNQIKIKMKVCTRVISQCSLKFHTE